MRNILQIKVGLRIKDLRAVHDVSQERFANKIGMDRTYLASIEVGQRNVTLQNLAKIANGFDMTLSEFFEGVRASGSGYRSSALQARGVRLGGGLTEGIVSTSDGASRFRCAAGRRWYGNAARCGFIVIRYLFVVFIQHVGIIKTATNEPLIEMVRYLGRRGDETPGSLAVISRVPPRLVM